MGFDPVGGSRGGASRVLSRSAIRLRYRVRLWRAVLLGPFYRWLMRRGLYERWYRLTCSRYDLSRALTGMPVWFPGTLARLLRVRSRYELALVVGVRRALGEDAIRQEREFLFGTGEREPTGLLGSEPDA